MLKGSYEEAQQNWLAPYFTVLTVFWQVQEDTLLPTYVKLSIQVPAVLLNFRVHGDGVCSWRSDTQRSCTVHLIGCVDGQL